MRPDAPSSALSVRPWDRRKSREKISRSYGGWKFTFSNSNERSCVVSVNLAPFTNIMKHDLLTYLFRVSSETVRVSDIATRTLICCSVTNSWCRLCSTRTAPSTCRPSMVSTALAFSAATYTCGLLSLSAQKFISVSSTTIRLLFAQI